MDFLTPLRYEEQLHCRRVSAVSAFLAETEGLSSPEVTSIAQSALFHDVGKAALPQEILYKTEPLSHSEQSLILSHTIIGMEILEGTESFLSTASIVAYQHHEWLNGSGYLGLMDRAIHPHTKLVSVADVFDTFTFRNRTWDMEQVRNELQQRSGVQLEEKIVSLLLDNLEQVLEISHRTNTHNAANTHS